MCLLKRAEKCWKRAVISYKVKTNKINAITATVVLAEVTWTLDSLYKVPKESIVDSVKSIHELADLAIIDSYDHLYALQLWKSTNVKYIDCLIASLKPVRTKKATVVSYDRDFARLPVLWKTPAKVL